MCWVNTTRCPKWCTSCYFCDHGDFFSVYISCTFYFFPKEVNIWFDVIHLSTRCCIKSPFLDIPNSRTLPILMQFEILKCIISHLTFCVSFDHVTFDKVRYGYTSIIYIIMHVYVHVYKQGEMSGSYDVYRAVCVGERTVMYGSHWFVPVSVKVVRLQVKEVHLSKI